MMSSLSLNFLRVKGREESELYRYNLLTVLCDAVVTGYQLGTAVPKSRDVHSDALTVPGFQHLAYLLTQHIDIAQVYFLLMALMMGQPVKLLPADPKVCTFNLLFVTWHYIFARCIL